ncbi:MAG TPA: thioredoxin domain-containing protein [Terriglobales bacterium]|nr:thioredoxin domain-containing protein [Terriglobales bacterium]
MRIRSQMAMVSAFMLTTLVALGQAPAAVNQHRLQALKPPVGAKVAVIVFEDLQCPDCARAHPLVKQVSEQQKVPVVHRDFPLPMHNYSRQAAIYARYFDTKSQKLGNAFREYVFLNQAAITPANLKEMVDKFAQSNGVTMPFLLDPGKRLEAKVEADVALGKRIGIQHTPTIFVVGSGKKMSEPFVEVVDRSQLAKMIQDMKDAK